MQVKSKELKMAILKTYNDSKLTQLHLYPIRCTPDSILTQILNWISPDPNYTWPIPDPNPYQPEHGTRKWSEPKLHLNRTEPDPNMVDQKWPKPELHRNRTQTRPEHSWSKSDPNWTKIRPKLDPNDPFVKSKLNPLYHSFLEKNNNMRKGQYTKGSIKNIRQKVSQRHIDDGPYIAKAKS